MIDPTQFYNLVIVKSFENLALFNKAMDSEAARKLVFATFLHESNAGTYLKQVKGPALGVYQVEPATFDWIWEKACTMNIPYFPISLTPREQLLYKLVTDLDFATKICRLRYWMVPVALPSNPTLQQLASYWAKYYQTDNDPVKIEQFIKDCSSKAPNFF